jgi:hypothetical protein
MNLITTSLATRVKPVLETGFDNGRQYGVPKEEKGCFRNVR